MIDLQALAARIEEMGADHAAALAVRDIPFDPVFRTYCEANTCGNYGRNWRCPPDEGPIDELIAKAKTFDYVLVYQTISDLEDSFDFEGMMEAGQRHNDLSRRVTAEFAGLELADRMHLGAGGCRMCKKCARITNEPCRHPAESMSSLETYGINVSQLAKASGMNYINGVNTVTYFAAYFVKL